MFFHSTTSFSVLYPIFLYTTIRKIIKNNYTLRKDVITCHY
nr:MAG TPA: hypothetical protein [Caudoviricetes sp.]DAY27185.1 MAG TPA: hypothetical protein [Caudoviricetes sp.]DAY91152.1 MAG TPA: hypothetical protein [Caudoviricetes sp.]